MEEALNSLIDEFHEYIDQINGTNEFEIFSKFYNEKTLDKINPWVRSKFNRTSIKSAEKARKFREDGNDHFKVGCNILAVLSYTKSVTYAPFDSVEFNLSLGNRSAALFHLREYEGCVQDLELCLTLNYPENKKFKLYHRLIQSYIDLKLGLKAKETHGRLLKYLEKLGNLSEDFDPKQILKYTETARNLNELIDIVIEEEQTNPEAKPIKSNKTGFSPEENKTFNNASALLTLKFHESKGRYVEAASDIRHGDVLFIEKTRCFVPITQEEDPNEYRNICYNCFQETCAPLPCDSCAELFCSLSCKEESWTRYHLFECVGSASEVWKNIGVNFLAFRIFLFGFQSGEFSREVEDGGLEIFREDVDDAHWYKRVCSLISNVEKMRGQDLLPHLVSTIVIISYLKDKTGFFPALRDKYQEFVLKSEEEVAREMGGVLLKHILQVICNASIIEGVKEEFFRKFNSAEEIKESGMLVQGTGLFPSVSLMNHSCDSNVKNYFLQDTIIVKANRNIRKGEEILNCYGHDCRSESTLDRKSSLSFQYYFECCCSACLEPSRPEMYENGLLCPKCESCALNQTKGVETARCLQCSHEFNTEEHTKILATSDKLYKKWQITKNIKYLEQCFQIERNIYYKYNYKLYDLIQDLQIYYKNSGRFPEWWQYTTAILDLDKRIFGCCSLKYGLNLRDTLINLLSKQFLVKTMKSDLMDQIKAMLQDSKEIFELYYPKNRLKYDFITSCIKKLQTNISKMNV